MGQVFGSEGPHERHPRPIARLMQHAFHRSLFRISPSDLWQPSLDVYELEDEIQVVVDLAGISRERIEVSFAEEELRISGWRDDPAPSARVRLHQIEIDHGYFHRVVPISARVDREKLEATYRDGFLRIRLPKLEESPPRQVNIRVPAEDEDE